FQAEDGIRDFHVTGVQTCALPISVEDAELFLPEQNEFVTRTELIPILDKLVAFEGLLTRLGQKQIEAALLRVFVDFPELSKDLRSEERRVGKECRARSWADHARV